MSKSKNEKLAQACSLLIVFILTGCIVGIFYGWKVGFAVGAGLLVINYIVNQILRWLYV
jgi:hypothetical protein